MNVDRLLARLAAHGVIISLVGERLCYRLPQGAIERSTLEKTLTHYKPELVARTMALEQVYIEWMPMLETLYLNEPSREAAARLECEMLDAWARWDHLAMDSTVRHAQVLVRQTQPLELDRSEI